MTKSFFFFFIFLVLYCAFGFFSRRKKEEILFLRSYFLANQGLNFFVMALLVASSYVSASSFISGPSAVYRYGLSFVFLAVIQIPTNLILFVIVGERLNLASKEIGAINIIDYIRYRYFSCSLAFVSSLIVIFFSLFLVSAQLMGGAKLLEVFFQTSYADALFFFSLFVFLYVCLGGFKMIAYVDSIQVILMVIASILLFSELSNLGGGISNIFKMAKLNLKNDLFLPSNLDLKIEYIISFWILIGIGSLGLPQFVNNFIAFKDGRAIRFSLPIVTFIIGFLVVIMHLIGFFSLVIFPEFEPNDKVILNVALEVLNPGIFMLFFIGLLSAIMSTIDSGFLFLSSIWVKLILSLSENIGIKIGINKIIIISNVCFMLIIVILSLKPPDFLLFLNIFAIGALEVAFFSIIIFGLYLNFVSKISAFISQFLGLLSYLAIIFYGEVGSYHFHPVVPSLFISVCSFLIVNFVCQKCSNI
ncbi:sodium:solute symporter family transporter [Borrelia miyamotoi]|uniref:Sodium/pantothenate symporter n=1 Tax=Borrelia miyamotoi TaxID=47466 RepID=A0AAQ2WWD1_9SPIR|nr:sodium/pantothenate symporter [Borrelia miyamotoi]QTL83891.1 sodium/pantothenate symporter [Borrelia miyamotoi]WAZ84804.1 sodium/pantothenate symporter [Borrelia miyamotoi]WAZ90586.1 sodium/pantothenate symporter [Borrelia miyamotoi]WAZ91870.1 sodium/pantothenate symporter [Borrelia miyamotoi]WAZ93163.1 sodium/pantothenate symporter [Borrelia miyamotoi]